MSRTAEAVRLDHLKNAGGGVAASTAERVLITVGW